MFRWSLFPQRKKGWRQWHAPVRSLLRHLQSDSRVLLYHKAVPSSSSAAELIEFQPSKVLAPWISYLCDDALRFASSILITFHAPSSLINRMVSCRRILGQQRLHPRHQIRNPERLGHHSVHSSLNSDIDLFASRIGSNGNDWNMTEDMASSFLFSDSSDASQAIHYWHLCEKVNRGEHEENST